MNKNQERLGETHTNSKNQLMTIVKYNKYRDVDIQFDDGTIVKTSYDKIKNGVVKNPNYPIVKSKGYIGIGDFKSESEKGKSKTYAIWEAMIRRCYTNKYKAYINCTVCEEWLNYQNFAKWYNVNYYDVENERMSIDKDILSDMYGKEYSPEKCCIIPLRLNTLFTFDSRKRKDLLPVGVKGNKKGYSAYLKSHGKETKLGTFDSAMEAGKAYREAKSEHVISVINQYKGKIPDRIYNILIEYAKNIPKKA